MRYKKVEVLIDYKRIGNNQLYYNCQPFFNTNILHAVLEWLVSCDKLKSLDSMIIEKITIVPTEAITEI